MLFSSLSVALLELAVLRRDGEVSDDMRRRSLKVRDSFLSSGEDAEASLGDLERKYPSFLDDTDNLLSERGSAPAARGLGESAGEADLLRSTSLFAVDSRAWI